MIIVGTYTLVKTDDEFFHKMKISNELLCPICHNKTIKSGIRRRKYIDIDSIQQQISLPRVWCPKCNRTHNVLPDFLIPYKRHCAETIEICIDSAPVAAPVSAPDSPPDTSNLFLEVSTCSKIKDWFLRRASDYKKYLAAIGARYPFLEKFTKFSVYPWENSSRTKGWLSNIIKIIVNCNFW
jgi:hypothetical protein